MESVDKRRVGKYYGLKKDCCGMLGRRGGGCSRSGGRVADGVCARIRMG